jgi:hypothetical protein
MVDTDVAVVGAGFATLYPRAASWYVGADIPGKPRVFMPYVGVRGLPAGMRGGRRARVQGVRPGRRRLASGIETPPVRL